MTTSNPLTEYSQRNIVPDVSPEYCRRIESIRWLLYLPEHRLEAVRQANGFVQACLCSISQLDSRDLVVRAKSSSGRSYELWTEIRKIQYLLTRVMRPDETLAVCRAILEERNDDDDENGMATDERDNHRYIIFISSFFTYEICIF